MTDGSTIPLGQIRLPVTFGNHNNYHTELIDFDIAHISLPYNAILGYPALAKFIAATHPGYNAIKMPGSSGILTVVGDTKDALLALKLALKSAVAARPGAKDTPEIPGAAPAKNKQLFSLDRAETKQVPVDDRGSGPTFTVGAGRPSPRSRRGVNQLPVQTKLYLHGRRWTWSEFRAG